MKILPKKIEIDRAKAQERKNDIDSGLALAKRIDTLREVRLKEEAGLKEWRESSIRAIQTEIDGYLEVKENLRIETEKAELRRKELIAPLDDEWAEVNKVKSEVTKDKEQIFLSKEQLKESEKDIEQERLNVKNAQSRVKTKEDCADKKLTEATEFREEASKEYEIAKSEREFQTEKHEKAMDYVRELETQYEVGIKTNEMEARILKEKEAEIIIRENDLERRVKRLKDIKNYAPITQSS